MARRRIRLLGDPILRLRADPVEDHRSPAARLLVDDLRDTLRWAKKKYGVGRAVAAPQIGAPVRILYAETARKRFPMLNPEIVEVGPDDFEVWDDCFSFPHLLVRVVRAHEVTVRYTDLLGREHTFSAQGALAELLQHELDHLDGILAVDRAFGPDAFAYASEWPKRHEAAERHGQPVPRRAFDVNPTPDEVIATGA